MTTIKPTNNNIMFILEDSDTGIMIKPDQTFTKPFGRVKFVADDVTCCAPGDRILINPHAAMQIPTECGVLWVIPASAVYAKYVDPAPESLGNN